MGTSIKFGQLESKKPTRRRAPWLSLMSCYFYEKKSEQIRISQNCPNWLSKIVTILIISKIGKKMWEGILRCEKAQVVPSHRLCDKEPWFWFLLTYMWEGICDKEPHPSGTLCRKNLRNRPKLIQYQRQKYRQGQVVIDRTPR